MLAANADSSLIGERDIIAMHPTIWKAIVQECLVWEADRNLPAPDFTKEQFADCILELWALVKLKEKAALTVSENDGH